MSRKSPLLAQLVGAPESPREKIILAEKVPAKADFQGQEAWHASLDRYAKETAGDVKGAHVLDFSTRDLVLKDVLTRHPFYLWPSDLYIPSGANYKDYWPWPCPADHRYGRQWISGNDVNQAAFDTGHVWAYTAINQYMPHAHSEAGIGFLFTPNATLAVYSVKPTMSVIGTHRWSIATNYYGGGWIYEWGVIYIAAWSVSPVDGSLDLVTPFGVSTIMNESWLNQGTEPVTTVIPSWSPGSISTNILLQGGRTYLVGVIAAVDVTNTWNVPQGKWPANSDWRTWCTLELSVPQINIDATTIYQP